MNIFSSKGAERVAFQLSPVAAGCAVFLSVLSSSAVAQAQTPAATDGVQQVVVSGIRRGIEGAISVKKDSSSIVEAISAEDIGKLPDVSIAEAIARLPGLAAQRVAGRAQVISVRGLSPDFATTLLNGREQVSTGDNRSVEFDQYPSE
jgi:outer membrane receptor for ferrienterochelin and colicin